MSITLLCLVKGNTTASAFAVDIDREKLISRLKEAIKENQKPFFDNTSSKNIKLWKVEISGDHDDQLKNLSLHDIGDYWSEKPTKKSIYVIVKPPVSAAASSREQKLLGSYLIPPA